MTKILMVDDDLLVLATITMGLQQFGYTAIQANSGVAAMEICNRDPPDLVLLDIRMPNMNGIDVGRSLNERKIPFIFLTAYGDEEMVKAAVEVRALGYLIKPLEIERIVPAIEVALVRADDLSKASREIDNLTSILDSNREIDIAIGILMERYNLNRITTFEKLRNYARSNRKKIIDVAKEVISGAGQSF